MHTQSYIDHIRSVTPKSRLNRRRSKLDRYAYGLTKQGASDIVTGLAALVGVSAILYIAYSITTK